MALLQYDKVATIGFDYGQTNSVELECRQEILRQIRSKFPDMASKLEEDCVVDIRSFGKIAYSSLTSEGKVLASNIDEVATDYVPLRNIMFLSCAGARAYCIGAHTIYAGTCQADYEGYPDCRRETLDAMQKTLWLASDYEVSIHAPLIDKSKAETWKLLQTWGGDSLVEFMAKNTHSCNQNNRTDWHEWGYGCGDCESCLTRRAGYEEFKKMG